MFYILSQLSQFAGVKMNTICFSKLLACGPQPILSEPLIVSILYNIANIYLVTVIKEEIMCDISTNQLLKIFIKIPKDRNI